jgi:quercetin dioxygenase-like cupin family protein/uncharacterized damage-inducible protein DinB
VLLLAAGLSPLLADHHAPMSPPKVLLDNAHFRMVETTIPRGAKIDLHSHPDHTAYVLKGGRLRLTGEDGKSQEMDLKAGDAMFASAVRHTVENVGKTEIRLVVTELKDTEGMTPALTGFERAELVAMLEHARSETQGLIAKATGELFTKKPGPDRWSVAEVLEHLGAAEGMLLGLAQGTLATPEDPEWHSIAAGTSVGQMFQRVTDRSQKFQAPEPLQPKGGKSRAELLAQFVGAREVTLDYVRTTDAALKSHTGASPAGKMSAYQFLVLMAAHNMRHNLQIAEAMAQVGGK